MRQFQRNVKQLFAQVSGPLLSRSRLFRLEALDHTQTLDLLRRALADPDRAYGDRPLAITDEALEHLAFVAGGDARTALYWLAKMMVAGEDPEFVMRRLLILAGEDIGLADPRAVQVVAACAQALQYVGLPEGKYHLALATTYLATAPKSNSMTQYFGVESLIQEQGAGPVPMHLRDASYKGAARLGHGQGYQYPHSFPGHWVAQQYLPDGVADRRFYGSSDQGYEAEVKARLKGWSSGTGR